MIAGTAPRRKATIASHSTGRALHLLPHARRRPGRANTHHPAVRTRAERGRWRPAAAARVWRSDDAPRRGSAVGRPVVGGASGAARSDTPHLAAEREGAELGPRRRSPGVGPGHRCLHRGAGALAVVLRRTRLPSRRPAARGRWSHQRPARPRQHERVRSRRRHVAGATAHGRGALVSYQHYAAERRGSDPPTNTAEPIDLNSANPTWAYPGSMAHARRQMNATLLPTGDVLVTGGTADTGFSNPAGAVYDAELWTPATGRWTTLARNAVIRIYHQTTILLPDGHVLNTGSGGAAGAVDQLNYELYSPPYFFKGLRPTITGATPGAVTYGQALTIASPDGTAITKVTLIRLGSVTHAFDQSQRLVPLGFTRVTGGLSITLPASGATAPPGPYLLFLVNGSGAPSVGRIMLLH